MLQLLGIPIILLITRSQQSMCYQCRSATNSRALSVDIIFSDLSDPSVSVRQATSPHTPRVSTRTPWRNHRDTPPRTPWRITSHHRGQWNTMKPWKLLHWGSWIFHAKKKSLRSFFARSNLDLKTGPHKNPTISPFVLHPWKPLRLEASLIHQALGAMKPAIFCRPPKGVTTHHQVKPPKPWGGVPVSLWS